MADWKTDLKKAYKQSANEQVKDSDKQYGKVSAQTMGNAIARGLGRSSYTTQTMANIEEDKSNAANKIRTDMNLAYLQALKEEERWQQQFQLQVDQFNWQKEQAAAAAAAASGGNGGYRGTTGNPGTQNNDFTDYDPLSAFGKTVAAGTKGVNSSLMSNYYKSLLTDEQKKALGIPVG